MSRLSNSPKTERLIPRGCRDADEGMAELAVVRDKMFGTRQGGGGTVSHWTLETHHVTYISRGEMISMTVRERIIFLNKLLLLRSLRRHRCFNLVVIF